MTTCAKQSSIRFRFRVGVISLTILLFSGSINFALCHWRFGRTVQQEGYIAAADRNFAEGQKLLAEGSVISKRQAIEKFAEAARLWQALSDQQREAIALSFIGKVYDLLSEKHAALDFYNQTLAL